MNDLDDLIDTAHFLDENIEIEKVSETILKVTFCYKEWMPIKMEEQSGTVSDEPIKTWGPVSALIDTTGNFIYPVRPSEQPPYQDDGHLEKLVVVLAAEYAVQSLLAAYEYQRANQLEQKSQPKAGKKFQRGNCDESRLMHWLLERYGKEAYNQNYWPKGWAPEAAKYFNLSEKRIQNIRTSLRKNTPKL